MAVGLFVGLGLSLFWHGALAFSPGKLSSQSRSDQQPGGFTSHADFEKECARCHQPLKTRQAELCLECHTSVAGQLSSGAGLHSQVAEPWRCFACHSDHQGRAFDPQQAALEGFDHSITRFSLLWHPVDYTAMPLSCTACHTSDETFAAPEAACASCHTEHAADFMAQHQLDFGPACLDCHDGADRMARFDHEATAFHLDGGHSAVSCAGCHAAERFQGTPTACAGCHAEPDIHREALGADCADCHTTAGWLPARLDGQPFEHQAQTGFSLARHRADFNGQPLSCRGCHGADVHLLELETCIECHGGHDSDFMSEHQNQFGSDCLACHDGADRMQNFDHASAFPLEGRHAEIECEGCHSAQVFRGTPQACAGCHSEPEIHAGSFGLQCQYCHGTVAWTPAQLQTHIFPLGHGGQGEIACQTCHLSTYAAYTCYGCHDHQPELILESHTRAGISNVELPDCAKCHPLGNQ